MTERALFLDRDGIICHIKKYPDGFDSARQAEDVRLVDGIKEIIKLAHDKGWKVIEVSNQPGVAKGKQTQELSDSIESQVHILLDDTDVDVVYICQHHPQGIVPELSIICDCRKPKPGLLLKAAKEQGIDLRESLFLGDKASDILAGVAVGCKTMILLHDEDTPEKVLEAQNIIADFKVTTLREVGEVILKL